MAWKNPKIDWTSADGVSNTDLNDIGNNLVELSSLKADKSTTYTKTEVNTSLALKADKTAITNWVATSVENSQNGEFSPTIPNFVFTNGCTITFRVPDSYTQSTGVYITQLAGGMGYYRLCTADKQLVDGSAIVAGAYISVTLDNTYKPIAGRDDIGTAFFKAGGASSPKFPTYTGSHALFGTVQKGYIELYGSGVLTPKTDMPNVEAFLVGGGGGGGYTYYSNGAGGGGGGYVKTMPGLSLVNGQGYSSVIGAGGTGGGYNQNGFIGGSTSIFSNTALGGGGGGGGPSLGSNGNGGSGGSGGGGGGYYRESEAGQSYYYNGGNGGSNGANGTNGGNNGYGLKGTGAGIYTAFNGVTYSGGGGGGGASGSANGVGGINGANGGAHALGNTGGGGGGGSGNGGSGKIIIRWGY